MDVLRPKLVSTGAQVAGSDARADFDEAVGELLIAGARDDFYAALEGVIDIDALAQQLCGGDPAIIAGLNAQIQALDHMNTEQESTVLSQALVIEQREAEITDLKAVVKKQAAGIKVLLGENSMPRKVVNSLEQAKEVLDNLGSRAVSGDTKVRVTLSDEELDAINLVVHCLDG